MPELSLSALNPQVRDVAGRFFEEVLAVEGDLVESIHVTGSAATPEYVHGKSDINSVIVLTQMQTACLRSLAPLGRKYGKKGIRSPLLMTAGYIERSLDVFPLELLEMKVIHQTVYGEDTLAPLAIDRSALRLQCERELKALLIRLRQGYIASLGEPKLLQEMFASSLPDFIRVFRGTVMLLKGEAPVLKADVIQMLDDTAWPDVTVLSDVLQLRSTKTKWAREQAEVMFDRYYEILTDLVDKVDHLDA